MSGAEPPGAAEERWTPNLCYFLGFLTLISMFNYMDRSLLGLVLPLIKEDLQLSDTALGLISGLAFVLFYSTLGIPIASLADRSNRRNIVAIGFAAWSLMTAVSGSVVNGWQMAVARFLMGAGEAAGLAPSQSMIADRFSTSRRPLALSIFTAAFALDALIFLPLAAWGADTLGWRTVFHISGGIGVALALIFFLTVKEPVRGAADRGASQERVPMLAALRILSRSRAYVLLMVGVSFTGGALYASGTWTTTFLTRVHGLSITEVGAVVGPARGVLGLIGILGAGYLANSLGKRDPRWRLWVPALSCLLFVPGQIMMLLSDTRWVWIAGLGITGLFTTAYQGPVYAAIVTLAAPRMRAVAISVLVLFTGLAGQVCGPLIVGVLNDALNATLGDQAIRYSLLVVAACELFAAIAFYAASQVASKAPAANAEAAEA
ncbi:MAG: major facilitator superfamily protein [Sphingomonas bacterium]|nr:MFS transporter [Sphingomonas bacterium]MDB5688588.1 major facilitator superfamily protein [Sphingomonas bacterium]